MVAQWGMPTFFLALSADEISNMRWTEIDDIEALLNNLNKDFSWRDAPVECAALFHAKVQSFMRNFVLDDQDGLLGKVLHYVIRYEEQNRGSLHAHIILWVEATDADRVANEISAAISAVWDELRGEFVEPTDPDIRLLFQLVSQKNQHKCGPDGCLSGRDHRKYGYPFPEHKSKDATFNPVTTRWEYFRPRYVDRNTVSYHPLVMLLWGAHCNIQKITSTSWSFYVLKYAMKCDPMGKLNLDIEAAKRLGLAGVSDAQLKAISALTMSQPVSSTSAATAMLGIETIIRSESVHKVASAPPQLRLRMVSRRSTLFVSAGG
jgi:hypothetical protein